MPEWITMCAQKECPKAASCFRATAKPSELQCWSEFPYTAAPFKCEYYIEHQCAPGVISGDRCASYVAGEWIL